MNILLVAATESEIKPVIDFLQSHWTQVSFSQFTKNSVSVMPLITGIGSTMMAFGLARYRDAPGTQLLIHAGLSGAYNRQFELSSLVEVCSEQWADLGAEDSKGQFLDAFELGLMNANVFPYTQGKLFNDQKMFQTGLKKVKGLTVHKTSGELNHINAIKNRFDAEVESMEGAGLFYACKVMDIPFVSIRAISNYVEPRNKSSWKIEESIENLGSFLIQYLDTR
jgi:futalosine hydrolase